MVLLDIVTEVMVLPDGAAASAGVEDHTWLRW
jgi:hypothetical protein